jgi:hypothetical protein
VLLRCHHREVRIRPADGKPVGELGRGARADEEVVDEPTLRSFEGSVDAVDAGTAVAGERGSRGIRAERVLVGPALEALLEDVRRRAVRHARVRAPARKGRLGEREHERAFLVAQMLVQGRERDGEQLNERVRLPGCLDHPLPPPSLVGGHCPRSFHCPGIVTRREFHFRGIDEMCRTAHN